MMGFDLQPKTHKSMKKKTTLILMQKLLGEPAQRTFNFLTSGERMTKSRDRADAADVVSSINWL